MSRLATPQAAYLIEYTFEQEPGGLESVSNLVPQGNTIFGVPAHLEFRTTHFLFAMPGSRPKLSPIVLRRYNGDWQAGVDLYKAWRRTWFKQRPIPDWAKDVHSWQQVQMNSPEDSCRYSYRDITKIGEDCARYGVRAIQLVGWSVGGQDRGNPSDDTDPRLGTWQELRDAISQIQARGVKVVLFGKFNWADMTTKWYRDALYRYETKDPYGIRYEHGGYSYDTPIQLAGINNRRFAVMCFLSTAYRQAAGNQFKKVTALNPAGFLYDEVCHHGPALYCFAADHGHPVPAHLYEGDIPMADVLDGVSEHKPDFLFAGEGPEDILLQHYPFSYFRIGDQHTPVCRYVDSQAPLMIAVTGFDDREKLNRALMYRYIISYEPFNLKGRLSDFPLTLEYGNKIDALRKRHKPWLWDAEYRDTLGARVTVDGTLHRLYSVFQTTDGSRAVVVVNQNFEKSLTATVDLPNPRRLDVVTPEEPERNPAPGRIEIPPRSAAVVIEQWPKLLDGRLRWFNAFNFYKWRSQMMDESDFVLVPVLRRYPGGSCMGIRGRNTQLNTEDSNAGILGSRQIGRRKSSSENKAKACVFPEPLDIIRAPSVVKKAEVNAFGHVRLIVGVEDRRSLA